MAVAAIRERLPSTWSVSVERELRLGDRHIDAVLTVRAADGKEVVLVTEVKRLPRPSDVSAIRERLAPLIAGRPGSVGLVVAQYLSPSVRKRLADAELSYTDATGNTLVRTESPAVFLSDHGTDKDPWRGPGRPLGNLRGEPAAKVVRALLDIAGPWGVRNLIDTSAASTGSVYRVVEFLEAEDLAVRESKGRISIPDWKALLRRWSADYTFLHTNRITRWIAPRGVPHLLERMRRSAIDSYALTGSVAAGAWAPYAPARSAMIYTSDSENAAAAWDLRPTDVGANVLIAQPAFQVALERTVVALDGLSIAAPAQVAVDLMTGPGRAPAEAEELIDWMGRNEQSWRGFR